MRMLTRLAIIFLVVGPFTSLALWAGWKAVLWWRGRKTGLREAGVQAMPEAI